MKLHGIGLGAALAVSQLFHVSGKSMSPTINKEENNSILLLDKISSWFGMYSPKVNDIVVFTKPGMKQKSVVKRVKAISGETVVTKNGTVVVVKPGHFWAVGDNQACSVDSNDYGQVPLQALIGRCLLVLPLNLYYLKRYMGLL